MAQVVDHMFGLVELDDRELASASWGQSLTAMAHAMFRALGRHGNAARLLAEQIPVGPNAMALSRVTGQVLRGRPAEPADQVRLVVHVLQMHPGHAMRGRSARGPGDDLAEGPRHGLGPPVLVGDHDKEGAREPQLLGMAHQLLRDVAASPSPARSPGA
ncbi:TetR/AcrR family transcriptional regulator C-terminal domain-containing protein [Streptomyces acidiscabies]|uniref:TetR/AcrR family transcriptional regulator C-terminal domain-containing protein n=1 Tax=Streptomyces acidiscabies TaxID=42234 RepID=UPI0038F6C36D